MNAAKLPNELNKLSEEDYNDTNKYILFEPYENKKYSIKINIIETHICIIANQIQNPNIFYTIELCLNDFYQLSKGFRTFDNLEEICDELNNIFISNKASIIKKDYIILIILTINSIGGKEQEINIELNRNTIDKENYDIKIKILKINELENEIKQIKEDKNILLKRIKDLEDLVNIQNNEIKKLRNIEIEQKNIIEKINNIETFINEHRYKIGKINNIEKILNTQK